MVERSTAEPPPSTTMAWPVTIEASLEARKAQTGGGCKELALVLTLVGLSVYSSTITDGLSSEGGVNVGVVVDGDEGCIARVKCLAGKGEELMFLIIWRS